MVITRNTAQLYNKPTALASRKINKKETKMGFILPSRCSYVSEKKIKEIANKVLPERRQKKIKIIKKEKQANKSTGKIDKKTKLLELGLLCDCTGSMDGWIARAKKTLRQIIENTVKSCDGQLEVRVCFVGYRDLQEKKRFSISGFDSNIEKVKKFISSVEADGGGDQPEDVVGGLQKMIDQKWTAGSERMVFHICDAPCHGKKYHNNLHDSYPDGCPSGLKLETLMKQMHDMRISFTCIKLDDSCNKMIKIMQQWHPGVVVTDMSKACATKSKEEVNKMFVDSATVILRGKVGGRDALGNKRTKTRRGEPLWNPEKLQKKDIFSNITYMKVKEINGDKITVQNHYGGSWIISRHLMARDMDSADHYGQEIKCTMTELSTIIQSCGDYVFKVEFRKKIDAAEVYDRLRVTTRPADFKNSKTVAELAKNLQIGESCEMVCHLVNFDNNLGRSTVVDLNAIPGRNIRQVDHRSIDYIIFKGVKYTLGKRPESQAHLELPLKPDRSKPTKWDESQLALGDWFSQVNYYVIKDPVPCASDKESDTVTVCTPKNSKESIQMSRDILEYEMNSGTLYEKEQPVTRSELVNVFTNAKQAVMTVKFHKKVDETQIKSILKRVKKAKLKNNEKAQRQFANELLTGQECELTCCLTNSVNLLGRSGVVDLKAPYGMGFRQIDHRTIESVVLKNIKYQVK